MSFVTMADEITLESLTEEQFECFIEYYHENYPEDFKSDLENLEEIYKMMNGGVEYPRTQNASPSEIKEPYEPSPRMYSYEQPSCLGSTFVGETLRKSDQLHQTFEKSSIAMTRKLDDMIELPKSQPKRTYNEDLECEIVMVKMPKCMAWLDDEPIVSLVGPACDPGINEYVLIPLIWEDEDVHDLRSAEIEFSAIVFNDTLMSEPMVSSLNNEIDFRIPFDESNDEDYTVEKPICLRTSKSQMYLIVPFQAFSIWKAFGGNTRDLGSFGEEMNKTTDLHQNLLKNMFTERGDGVTSIKRLRHELRSNGVSTLVTPSEHGRPKGTLEDSVSRD
ncbi:hypothetical protein Tco_0693046 [Tanacetum coccineum]